MKDKAIDQMIALFTNNAFEQNPRLSKSQRPQVEAVAKQKITATSMTMANASVSLDNMVIFVIALIKTQTKYGPNYINELKRNWIRYASPEGSSNTEQAALFLAAAAKDIHGQPNIEQIILKRIKNTTPAPQTIWEMLCIFPFALK